MTRIRDDHCPGSNDQIIRADLRPNILVLSAWNQGYSASQDPGTCSRISWRIDCHLELKFFGLYPLGIGFIVRFACTFATQESNVHLLRILGGVHQALVIHGFYYYFITNFANPKVLQTVIWWAMNSSQCLSILRNLPAFLLGPLWWVSFLSCLVSLRLRPFRLRS